MFDDPGICVGDDKNGESSGESEERGRGTRARNRPECLFGAVEDDDRPSAPRPTQARSGINDSL
jgi:hypothetical protein